MKKRKSISLLLVLALVLSLTACGQKPAEPAPAAEAAQPAEAEAPAEAEHRSAGRLRISRLLFLHSRGS